MIVDYETLYGSIIALSKKIEEKNGNPTDLHVKAVNLMKQFAANYPLERLATVDLICASVYFASKNLDHPLSPLEINDLCDHNYGMGWLNTVSIMKRVLK